MLVVEHDEDMIRAADYVVDMGPGAGMHGGEVVAQGTPAEVMASASVAHRPLHGGRAADPGAGQRATGWASSSIRR